MEFSCGQISRQERMARGVQVLLHRVLVIKLGFSGGSIELFAGNVKLPSRSSEEITEWIAATQCGFETRVDSLRIPVFIDIERLCM